MFLLINKGIRYINSALRYILAFQMHFM